ncbi:MAG: protein translocase subunit SecDF [Bacteroidota bacterium]|nr:protein translocase subunit SecDF [Bacteroidota bacterium]
MQSKGAIKFFAIILAVVCLYQLSFTLVSRNVESNAREASGGNPKAYQDYLDSVATLGVYNLGLKDYTYREVKEREINLGLDLKGGMNVTLEVSVIDLIRSMANNSTDPTFNKALEEAQLSQRNSQKDFVTLFGEAFEKIDPNAKLAAIFSTMELQDRITFNSTNNEVINIIKEESDAAISRSFNILRTRIDKFGVTQPNIQQLGSGRILVELPGVKEPERVRKLLQGTAQLEFWETWENKDVFNYLNSINDALKNSGKKDSLLSRLAADSTGITSDNTNVDLLDSGEVPTATPDSNSRDTSKTALIDQIKGDPATATSDSSAQSFEQFAKDNPFFAVLSPAIFQNEQGQSEYQRGPVIGYALFKDTSKVNAILNREDIKALLPKNMKFLWGVKPPTPASKALELIAIKTSGRDNFPPLDGGAISDARQDFGQFNGKPEISMRMNAEGAQTWRRLTSENVGKSIAIVLDESVYSFPTVQGEIAGGSSSITGNFEINEAKDMANILKAGKLPAPARIVEEAVVGPSLGDEAIQSGLISFVVALVLILVFMVFYYSTAGWVADLAMFANVFFIFGVLASLGAVLTLPGIAGIVLTLGMAVDANILIYERVREELRNGKGTKLAIADGFKMAYSSIIDSNVTTLLAGIILYVFGSGPIQGFATTLIIGILTSLFSSIFLTRLIFEWLMSKNKVIRFSTPLTENAFRNIKLDWVSKRRIYYMVSGTFILIGIASMAIRGFSTGVDFKGGRSYVVRFDESVSTVDIRGKLATPFGGAPEVKTFGSDNQVKITTSYLIEDNTEAADAKVEAALSSALGIDRDNIMSSQKVGPTVADDIKASAGYSLIFSMIVMFLYIVFRFRKWQFGLGAVTALAHDILILLSIFSLFWGILPFSLEIDQAFIAAILTVMGFSINDTVVVFDRVREFLGLHQKMDSKTVINNALNATLSRTINTSLTIFFVLFAIFVFGGEVIRGFSFAMMIGILVGTYSSLCIATPIVVDFTKATDKDRK